MFLKRDGSVGSLEALLLGMFPKQKPGRLLYLLLALMGTLVFLARLEQGLQETQACSESSFPISSDSSLCLSATR